MPIRALTGRGGSQAPPDRLPQGQGVTHDFPVL
jgi:hypothetical protein